MSIKSLAPFAAVLFLGLPGAANAQTWQAAYSDGNCSQVLMPSRNNPYFIGITGTTPSKVMVSFTSANMPPLAEGRPYEGVMRFRGGEVRTSAHVQQGDPDLTMVGMMMDRDQLELLAGSNSVRVEVGGRSLGDLALPGRVKAVTDLETCMNATTRQAALGSTGDAATQPPQTPQGPTRREVTDKALAAAAAAGDQVASASGPGSRARPGRGNLQDDFEVWMTMFRMNNRLINNGGNFADPEMGLVINGLSY